MSHYGECDIDAEGTDEATGSQQHRAEALAPVQTRPSYYASSKRARAILGQRRSTIDLRETILDGGILLVSTAQGVVGRDVAALVGACRPSTSSIPSSASRAACR